MWQSRDAARVLSHLGNATYHSGGAFDEAHSLLLQAVELARAAGDRITELQARTTIGHLLSDQLRHREALAELKGVLAELSPGELLDIEYDATFFHAWSSFLIGDRPAAELGAARQLHIAEQVGNHRNLAESLVLSQAVAMTTGDWAQALRLSDRALALTPSREEPYDANVLALILRAALEYQIGDPTQGGGRVRLLLDSLAGAPVRPAYFYSYAAVGLAFLGVIGEQPALLRAAERFAQPVVAGDNRLPPNLRVPAHAAMVLVGSRQDAAATRPSALAQRSAELIVPFLCADHVAALDLASCGDHDGALDAFARARGFCRRAGFLPELGWVCVQEAETRLQRGAETAVADLLETAAELANQARITRLSDSPDSLRKADTVELFNQLLGLTIRTRR